MWNLGGGTQNLKEKSAVVQKPKKGVGEASRRTLEKGINAAGLPVAELWGENGRLSKGEGKGSSMIT